MRHITIGLLAAALLLSSPAFARAQYSDERQNPKEYTQEDSNPFKLISYILSPIGFALEWTIARPLHYVTTETPLAPAFRPADDDIEGNAIAESDALPAPIAQLPPPDRFPSEREELTPHEGTVDPRAPTRKDQPLTGGRPPESIPPSPVEQPVLH